MKKPILISFSGGRTSAFMAKMLMEHEGLKDVPKVVCFANTGKEYEATLDFVNECDNRWGLGVVWLEALVNPEKGKGTTFKIVDYGTASRKGEPFEAVIAKYGIPNKQFPHCTRELKQLPIRRYMQEFCKLHYFQEFLQKTKRFDFMKSVIDGTYESTTAYMDFINTGFKPDWKTAVGIRADEPHRINRGSDSNFTNPYFPLGGDLISVDEGFIRRWWDKQDFDLDLRDYQSNCDLCWKKSKRKRLTLIDEDGSISDWWEEMEKRYGKGMYQFDQREGLTVPDLVEMAKRPFQKAVDKHELNKARPPMFEPEMDVEWDCMCKSS